MNIDDKLNQLRKIEQLEAPPFLLTRIKQRLNNLENQPAPVQWKWAFAASAIIVFTFNTAFFFSQGNTTIKGNINAVVSAMNLSNTNELYHE